MAKIKETEKEENGFSEVKKKNIKPLECIQYFCKFYTEFKEQLPLYLLQMRSREEFVDRSVSLLVDLYCSDAKSSKTRSAIGWVACRAKDKHRWIHSWRDPRA